MPTLFAAVIPASEVPASQVFALREDSWIEFPILQLTTGDLLPHVWAYGADRERLFTQCNSSSVVRHITRQQVCLDRIQYVLQWETDALTAIARLVAELQNNEIELLFGRADPDQWTVLLECPSPRQAISFYIECSFDGLELHQRSTDECTTFLSNSPEDDRHC